ncbi:Choline dehydrogenase [Catalinimonas alkaloidigena]|uniref:Choline dehydrogenase n=1 Tax=Catalinimonas alkaloidigena TaxID=1075417 RepID=A0A1G8ZTF6_9BACT|nr:GMC family oxidoreductase [Catalinimonas alkaloidigena]SDK18291.1 Choline dehydrogenase [Catalinimonas alkaloidigena]
METEFDAIVIGSGISGGWAAKELCEQGLKTLLLERGRNVEHLKDYPTANWAPWQMPHRGRMTRAFLDENPLISKAAGFGEDTAHFFVRDADHPYVQQRPFDWIRGYQVGGKSLTWGRACQRWSDYEFKAPARDQYGIAWPIGYDDVAPWYTHVEKFIGVCGNHDGLDAMPDGDFLPPFDLNCVEQHMQASLRAQYPDRHLVQGRWAHLSEPKDIHLQQGRGQCQCRNLCMRGCPYGGYFSSVSSTIPWAANTGNLTLRPFSVVHSIVYDEATGKAAGVKVIDAQTKEELMFRARVIFVNASALNTNLILLNSRSARFPHGLGNDHDLLGRYVGFHLYRGYAQGRIEGFEDKYVYGRNPTECIIANYRNLYRNDQAFKGGYTTFTGAYRVRKDHAPGEVQLGGEYKDRLSEAGDWYVYMYMQGETMPKASNRVYLSEDETDPWGIPKLVTDVGYDENDEKMIADFLQESRQMLTAMGCQDISTHDNHQAPGLDIHEMGGARMGHDPKTSLLNAHNQLHACPNVFVTDGACMTSTGNQSPSILYMALTARAATYAAAQVKQGTL